MSWPEPACASAAIVMRNLSPVLVMKSAFTSTFSLSAHSWTILRITSLAPGTQWSQNPTLTLPAAWAPRTNGVANIAAAPAASRLRLVTLFAVISTPVGLRSVPAGKRPLRPAGAAVGRYCGRKLRRRAALHSAGLAGRAVGRSEQALGAEFL